MSKDTQLSEQQPVRDAPGDEMQPATSMQCPHGRLVGCVLCNLSAPTETPEMREEMRALARRALIALDARKDEDIDEWARRLIASVDGPIPSSVTPPTDTPAETREYTDTERLDWLEQRLHGTGETLTMGGSCSWGIEVQRGRYGKSRPLGEGDDLREAIDDAMDAALSVPVQGAP